MRTFLLGLLAGVVLVVGGLSVALWSAGDPLAPVAIPSAPPSSGEPVPADGETSLGDARVDLSRLVGADQDLRDVQARGRGVVVGPDGFRARTLVVDATYPYAVAAAALGPQVRLFDAGGGLAGIEQPLELLGRRVDARAEGSVRVEGGQVVLEPERITLGDGGLLSDALSAAARALVTYRFGVEGLPKGLVLTDVDVVSDGFRVRVEGADVLLPTP